jgi:hypothetical protein
MSDFTFALRQLRKAPIFTLTAVFSIALGIELEASRRT